MHIPVPALIIGALFLIVCSFVWGYREANRDAKYYVERE